MADAAELHLNNDFSVRAGEPADPLTVESSTTGATSPFTGATIVAFIAATETYDATAIHGDLSITLAEVVGTPGFYVGAFDGSKLSTHLAALIDTKVFLHRKSGGTYHKVTELMVRGPRIDA